MIATPTLSRPLAAGLAAAGGLVCRSLARTLRTERARAAAAERRERHLLALLERDRRRLAEVLHDGPVQDLLALEMEVGMAAYAGVHVEPSVRVGDIVRDLRAVSEGLRSPALQSFGLAPAVEALADRFEARHTGVVVDRDLAPVDLSPLARTALFRVAQEALENAAYHGLPGRVEVALRAIGNEVRLTVTDDGEGYNVPADLSSFAEIGRYGLLGMLVHTEAVGGRLEIQSRPGQTTVRVDVPQSPPAV